MAVEIVRIVTDIEVYLLANFHTDKFLLPKQQKDILDNAVAKPADALVMILWFGNVDLEYIYKLIDKADPRIEQAKAESGHSLYLAVQDPLNIDSIKHRMVLGNYFWWDSLDEYKGLIPDNEYQDLVNKLS